MTIRNTTSDMQDQAEQLFLLADAMGNGGSPARFIENQELAGQRQLVNSDRLPTKSSNSDEEFAALGITFGEPDPADPLFRPATLPPGWKREGTDHSMHSNVVDEVGRKRIGVFYKAAFYDRRAGMHIVAPAAYLRSCLWDDCEPVLDDVWLTGDIAIETLGQMMDSTLAEAATCDKYAKEGRGDVELWPERAGEHRAEADKIAALISRIGDRIADGVS